MPLAATATEASGRRAKSAIWFPPAVLGGFLLAILAVALIAFLSYSASQRRASTSAFVSHSYSVVIELQGVLSTLKDAETGERGYLLTGVDSFLEPYEGARRALPEEIKTVRGLISDNAEQQHRLDALEELTNEKMELSARSIELRRKQPDEARATLRADEGKRVMDRIRDLVAQMLATEQRLLEQRQQDWAAATSFSNLITWGSSLVLLLLIAAAAVIISRDYRSRERQTWLRTGQMALGAQIQGDPRLETLGENVLSFLAEYLNAQVGSIYIAEGAGTFRRFAGYALDSNDVTVIHPGQGLVGQVAKEGRARLVRDVPEGYLPVNSSLGQAKARELLLAPAIHDGIVHAVLEFGFFHAVHPADVELLNLASEAVGVAVRAARDRSRLEELLEETQRQAEELQTQQEELRVSNEELEEQGRVLKLSQGQLEAQQAELEQTNSQLEEQAQLLESQKDELSRAQEVLQDKATELERSNQYKSEFLANMSHELRTPLNSSLILAKLLADNKDGNLTAEQVKFAHTISGAGHDLLTLINDILDLSKIEAGKVEMHAESVHIPQMMDGLIKTLQPLAQDKGLNLYTALEPGAPERMQTDPQRLGQILTNLLSNAIKFTDTGEVSMQILAGTGTTVSFAIRDTGIGIASDQQAVIFEAFRQADGTTHRKHGGTGLGLSISRDLARLLGGDVTVQSSRGSGSVFTLTLPITYQGPVAADSAAGKSGRNASLASTPTRSRPSTAYAVSQPVPSIEDDRAHLNPDRRLILIIEDDARFAVILRDLAREMNFQCIVALSAEEGLAAAAGSPPSAIVLDVHLPDGSGLGVLDQLKANPSTRHIPVHMVSVADYSQEALERGAVGYALKPVKREQLVEAFRRLEAKFSQGLRRVLVVEDDQRQRESIEKLLADDNVHIIGAGTGAEALEQIQRTQFDCIVIDLNLPDFSGYNLLEKTAEAHSGALPPIIVYTGRSLTRDEEQKLRRFSKSIILKDARSPERLLDEVTLFLHQVESKLPPERQRMLREARNREAALDGKRILVVEDDVRNIYALTSLLEPKGVRVELARNGKEALRALEHDTALVDLVLMDIMMPEMDGLTAMREIRKNPQWQKLPILALTAKAMKDDAEKCLAAGANDYIAKPLDVEKLLSLIRVWMPK